MSPSGQVKSGFLYGFIAYLAWGLIPLYFDQIRHIGQQAADWNGIRVPVGAAEILAHRIVWSLAIMAVLILVSRNLGDLLRVLTNRKLLLTLSLSSILLAGNWLLYIYATVSGQVNEASLGYYMMPLVNAFLGTLILKERLRPLHFPALAMVVIGVSIPFLAKGEFTWMAVALPLTFGTYGLVRKMAPVESTVGLTVETLILTVPSLAFLVLRPGQGYFGTNLHDTSWLVFGGFATVLPLLTYTLSIRRLPLIAVSFIQFISPTVQMILAVTVLGESVGWDRWAAIGCVLVAVAIFLYDAVTQVRARRRSAALSIPSPPVPLGR